MLYNFMSLKITSILIFCSLLSFSLRSQDTLKISTDVLRVRKLPSSNSEIIAKVGKKSKLIFVEKSGVIEKIDGIVSEWIKIKTFEKDIKLSGYIFGAYIFDPEKKNKYTKCIESEKGITLFFDNGKSKYLKNKESDDYDEHITYSECSYVPEINAIVINGSLYEGNFTTIYNMKIGEFFEVWGEPIFSRDKKYFACISGDIEANYNPNGLQIFNSTYPFKKEFEFTIDSTEYLTSFQPVKINWESGNKVEVLTENHDKSKIKKYKFEKINNKWKLVSK